MPRHYLLYGSERYALAILRPLQAAIRGQGVALARSSLIADKLRSGVLVEPFVQRVAARSAYHLVHPLNPAPRASVQRFREWLLAQIAASSTMETHAP